MSFLGFANFFRDFLKDLHKVYTMQQLMRNKGKNILKLPGTIKVTPPLVTPSVEESLTRIADNMGEQKEQMLIRMS